MAELDPVEGHELVAGLPLHISPVLTKEHVVMAPLLHPLHGTTGNKRTRLRHACTPCHVRSHINLVFVESRLCFFFSSSSSFRSRAARKHTHPVTQIALADGTYFKFQREFQAHGHL